MRCLAESAEYRCHVMLVMTLISASCWLGCSRQATTEAAPRIRPTHCVLLYDNLSHLVGQGELELPKLSTAPAEFTGPKDIEWTPLGEAVETRTLTADCVSGAVEGYIDRSVSKCPW